MDQVTIINSTLGKALGGASGAYRSCLWGLLPYMQGLPYMGWRRGRATGGEGSSWRLTGSSPHYFLSSGGYTTGPEPLISLLRQRSRPYLFSNSPPPAVVGCASKALDLLMENSAIVQSMAAKTRRYDAHRGEMVVTHLSTSSCPPSSFPSYLPLSQHPPWTPLYPSFHPTFPPPFILPASVCPRLCLLCSLGLYFSLYFFLS